MKTLEDLKAIASAVNVTSVESEDFNGMLLLDHTMRGHLAYEMPKDIRDYIATFNPELVSALLDEVLAGREKNEWAHNWKDSEKYDKARERLDAILRGE